MFQDFTLNLLAEIIGIVITVFLVNKLIQKREEQKIKPIKTVLKNQIEQNLVISGILLMPYVIDLRRLIEKKFEEGNIPKIRIDLVEIQNGAYITGLPKIDSELKKIIDIGKTIFDVKIFELLLHLQDALKDTVQYFNMFSSFEELMKSSPSATGLMDSFKQILDDNINNLQLVFDSSYHLALQLDLEKQKIRFKKIKENEYIKLCELWKTKRGD